MDVILGTSSQLRFSARQSLGLPFRVVPSNFAEEQTKADDVRELVVATAKGKAAVLAPQFPDSLVITVDSNNLFEGRKYGKPSSRAQAREWLMAMAGKAQDFYTALVLTHQRVGRQTVDVNISQFFFKRFSAETLDRYLMQVAPTTMSIGWGPVGRGHELLERFVGEPGADLALPLTTLRTRLREFGITV